MTDQLEHLDPRTHAKRGDPDTSHAAAYQLDSKATASLMRRLLVLFSSHADLTNQEAADLMGMEFHRVSKRLSDLDSQHLIEDTGDRRPGRTGRQQMARRITLDGILALSTEHRR